jgi:hypothetical protein
MCSKSSKPKILQIKNENSSNYHCTLLRLSDFILLQRIAKNWSLSFSPGVENNYSKVFVVVVEENRHGLSPGWVGVLAHCAITSYIVSIQTS